MSDTHDAVADPKRDPGLTTPWFVVTIAALMALNALAIDVMLPALDDISDAMGVAAGNDQQLVIYVYILGFGAPQIVFGPLSDRFGRRPILFISLLGYAAAGAVCAAAPTFSTLLAARFLQGVFASGCRVVAVSVVRDVFAGRQMARIMSLVMTLFMVVPILAPAIGQLILFTGPWRWIFAVLTIAGLGLLAWCALNLKETLPEAARQPLNVRASVLAYSEVLRNRVTAGYMIGSGVIFGSLFAFIGAAEQIITEVFGKEESFVLWFAGIAVALSAANFLNSTLVERIGMRRLSHFAVFGFTILSLALWAALTVFGERFEIFYPMFALIFACFGLVGSNFNALAMEPLGRIAGTASAAYGFATTTVSSLIGWLIGSRYDGSAIPVIWGFFVLGVICLIVVLITEQGKLFSSR
ncbi:MAG: multidrug effflux MFS transporter [Pseudomonadota bacterium]